MHQQTKPASVQALRRLTAFPDVAKIVAVVAVVTVHTVSAPNDEILLLTPTTWTVTTLIEVVCRWCVPVFVMVSGMLLLQSRTAMTSPGEFYRRRAARVAVPLLVWPIFYRFFEGWTKGGSSLLANIEAIYGGVPYFHLYFLYVIAGLYLIAPFLARAIDGLTQRQLAGLAVGGLALGALWSGLPPWLPATETNAFSVFGPFVGYFLAGCWLARVRLDRQVVRAAVAVFALLAAASTLLIYQVAHTQTELDWHWFYGYSTPLVIGMSVCVFLVIRWLCERREERGPVQRIDALHYVGEATFGIFLIHPVFYALWTQRDDGIPTEASELVWWIPATVAGLVLIAFAITVAMKRIPYVRRLV